MKFVRSILAALFLASLSTGAHAQAVQILPAKVCFQATAGLSGMVGILGPITPGSGGTSGGTYIVPLTGGSGTGATAAITVNGGSGAVTNVILKSPGSAYQVGDVLSADPATISGVSGFSIPVTSTSINSGLAGGTVGFYVPGTLTAKQTWQNASQNTLNTNPVTLDQNGCALIYGSGTYRQIVKDSSGNTIWDQTITGAATLPGGTSSGSPNAQTLGVSFSAVDGATISFIAGYTNTASMTLTPAGGSPIPVQKDTATGPTPLTGGEVVAGNQVTLTYSASGGFFHLSAYPATAAMTNSRTAVRQTVASGPSNSNGTPSFLAASSTTLVPTMQNITSALPLVTSAAEGYSGSAPLDYVFVYTSNPTVTPCSVNATCYIYENAQSGVFTTSTVPPIYQCGGTLSTSPGQFSFDYCGGGTGGSGTNAGEPMVGYLGNGSNAAVTPLVAIGECTAGASSLSACVAYAYNGYFESVPITTAPASNAVTTYSSNIGTVNSRITYNFQITTAVNGYAVGDEVNGLSSYNGNSYLPMQLFANRLSCGFVAGTGTTVFAYVNKSTGAQVNVGTGSALNGNLKLIQRRSWGGS